MAPSIAVRSLTPLAFIETLNGTLASLLRVQALPSTPDELKQFGLPAEIADALMAVSAASGSEDWVVAAFLYALSESCLAEHMQRGLKRLILANWKHKPGDQQMVDWCTDCMNELKADAWNWRVHAVSFATVDIAVE